MYGAIRDVRGLTNAEDYHTYIASDGDDAGSASARERNDRESRRSNRRINRTSAGFVDGADIAIAEAMAASRADPSLDVTAVAEAIAASLVRARIRTRVNVGGRSSVVYTGASDTEAFTDDDDSENPDGITKKDRIPYDRKQWRGDFINVTPFFFTKPNAVARVISASSSAAAAAAAAPAIEPGAPAVSRKVRELERRRRRELRARAREAEEQQAASAAAAAAAAEAAAVKAALAAAEKARVQARSGAAGQGDGEGLRFQSTLLGTDLETELAAAAAEIAAAAAEAKTSAAKGTSSKGVSKGLVPESDSFEEVSHSEAAPEDGHVSIFDDDDDDNDDDDEEEEEANEKKGASSRTRTRTHASASAKTNAGAGTGADAGVVEHLDIITPREAAQAAAAVPPSSSARSGKTGGNADDEEEESLLSLRDYWSALPVESRRVLVKARVSVFLAELEPVMVLLKQKIPFTFTAAGAAADALPLGPGTITVAEAGVAAGKKVVLAPPTTFRVVLSDLTASGAAATAVVSFNDRYGRELAAALAAFHCLVSTPVTVSFGPAAASSATAAAAGGVTGGAGAGRWPLKLGLWQGYRPHRYTLGGNGWAQVLPASEMPSAAVAAAAAAAAAGGAGAGGAGAGGKSVKKSWKAMRKGAQVL